MPLLWLSLAFLGGILLGDYLTISFYWYLMLLTLVVGVSVIFRILQIRFGFVVPFGDQLRSAPLPFWMLLIAILAGVCRFQITQKTITPDDISWYNDNNVTYVIEGVVTKPPIKGDTYTRLFVQTERFREVSSYQFLSVKGKILVYQPPDNNWHYGDRIRLQGQLVTPPENDAFSYREYLARQRIYSYMPHAQARFLQHNQGNPLLAAIYSLRDRALAVIYSIFPDPEASLLAGILLGVESSIPVAVKSAFVDTGTAHIIAISGFNINIISVLIAGMLGVVLGKRKGAIAAIIAITIYTILVGASAAVVRAAIMGGLGVFAAQFGRRQDGINTLAFVAALMALVNPFILWDVGFQLSFMATLGLILYAQPLAFGFKELFSRWLSTEAVNRITNPISEFVLFTFAAQITTLPILIYHFQRISLSSLIANPIILPVQAPLMVLGGIAVIFGLIYLPIGQIVGWLALPFATFTIRIVEMFAKIPGGVLYLGRTSIWLVILFYVVLFGLTFYRSKISKWFSNHSQVPIRFNKYLVGGVFLLLSAATFLVWNQALSAPDGKLHLIVLDVSSSSQSGDGLLIQTPTGRYVLIDGGVSPSKLSDALGRWLPLMHRHLDYLIIAGTGDAQLVALPASLERFMPAKVLWSGASAGTYAARKLNVLFAEHNIPVINAQAGQSLSLGDDAVLQVVGKSSRGAVLLLTWENFRVLLPIGLDFDLMDSLIDGEIASDVTALMLTENGYAPLNTSEWIERWQPQIILLSVAPGDKDGLPSQEVLQAVDGYSLLRTDRNGWIRLSTDGHSLWLETER